jgi:ABC-type antimicrobial peptide transport system permease subunit
MISRLSPSGKLMFRKHLVLSRIALDNLRRFRTRSYVVLLCLWAILVPFLAAVAMLEGIKSQAEVAVDAGADIFVSMDQYGQNAVIPLGMIEKIAKVDGVRKVMPRAVARGYFFNKLCLVVGVPLGGTEAFPAIDLVEGNLPTDRGEILVGEALARENHLRVGQMLAIPGTFAQIVGIFTSRVSIWSANLVFMSFEDVSALFHQEGYATDLLVYTRPGYEGKVVEALYRIQYSEPGARLLRLQGKSLVREYFQRGYNLKGGIFSALYLMAFAVSIPAILVASGLGLTERQREVGILKATGWQTHEVMELVFWENLWLSLIAAPSALLIAFGWLKGLNGALFAQFFISELGLFAKFPVPSQFLPLPLVLAFVLALVITLVGSLLTTWRTAIVSPMEAMR